MFLKVSANIQEKLRKFWLKQFHELSREQETLKVKLAKIVGKTYRNCK